MLHSATRLTTDFRRAGDRYVSATRVDANE